MSASELSKRIKLMMEGKELSVKELAERARIKPVTIYQWLRGESTPGAESLGKLANGLEVSTDFLLGLKSYDDVDAATIAIRESQAIYLRNAGIGATHPDYVLYEKLAASKSSPMNVEGWKQLSSEMLPIIREHDIQKNELGKALEKSKKDRKKTRGIVVAMQPRSQQPKRGSSRDK